MCLRSVLLQCYLSAKLPKYPFISSLHLPPAYIKQPTSLKLSSAQLIVFSFFICGLEAPHKLFLILLLCLTLSQKASTSSSYYPQPQHKCCKAFFRCLLLRWKLL
ncbi:hypothetical protein V6Z11_A11G237100 [Gossypium hirsutum]